MQNINVHHVQYVMLYIHACNVCLRLCYLLTFLLMIFSSQVVGHWAPFGVGNPMLFIFSGWKNHKASLHAQFMLRHQNWFMNVDCFFLWWSRTWAWWDPTLSVYLDKLSFNAHWTCPIEHWNAYICHMIHKATMCHYTLYHKFHLKFYYDIQSSHWNFALDNSPISGFITAKLVYICTLCNTLAIIKNPCSHHPYNWNPLCNWQLHWNTHINLSRLKHINT
jgi:hypothetical protein